MNDNKPLYVTKPFLPPLDEVFLYLEEIWRVGQVTNAGPLHQKLESTLAEFLGVKYISLFCNATVALLVSLKAKEVAGEVITTPFSFVATSHALIWNGLTPVFVDVDPVTLNIDPNRIEEAITPQTTCILAVHCYGTPCDVDAIQEIANRHGLAVIYDAAHAFGVSCHCGSVLNHGDMSVLSFHGTKTFQTFEGGAVVTNTKEDKRRIDDLKNFGFVSETEVRAIGINGKMNEFQAAMGLASLKYFEKNRALRESATSYYNEELTSVTGLEPVLAHNPSGNHSNFSYYPVRIKSDTFGATRDGLYDHLKDFSIFSRRYFYPLIPDFLAYKKVSYGARDLKVARLASSEILCLPLFSGISRDEQNRVIQAVKSIRTI